MLAQVYTYGHLVMVAFSLTVALGDYISRRRFGDEPWVRAMTPFMNVLCAATGVMALLVSTRPSIAVARGYLTCAAFLFPYAAVGTYLMFRGAYPEARRLQYRRRAFGLVAGYVVLFGLLWTGLLDGGRLQHVSIAGIEAFVPALSVFGAALIFGYLLLFVPLLMPLLLEPGPQAEERRPIAVPLVASPLFVLGELLICLGWLRLPPLGGYVAGLAGLTSTFIMLARIRTMGGRVRVGGYLLERRLGAGGMAEVHLARREGVGPLSGIVQRVAFKRIRPELADDQNFVRMFVNEARIVARLVHPNIVALREVGQEEGQLYLAMEYVEGAPLSRILAARGSLDEVVAVEIVVELAAALAYAHALRDDEGRSLEIIHRDVSPHNVLVGADGRVKLADFGIARSADRQVETATGILKGKIGYMAPEQIQNRPYDHRVDVYALGVVLFQMLVGRRPFEGESEVATLYQILSGEIAHRDRLERASAELQSLVLAMLDRDPDRRPAGAAQVREQLLSLRDESRARATLAELVAALGTEDPAASSSEEPTKLERRGASG